MNKRNTLVILVAVAVLLIYGYLFEFSVLSNSKEFILSNFEVEGDTVIVEVTSPMSAVFFKKIDFDTYNNELQLRIQKVRMKSFRYGSGGGYFRLNGHEGFMEDIDRIVIKYADRDVEVWKCEDE